jgi:hypothetical protein
MADARAQEAFEILYTAFAGRSYTDRCVQHATMDVDYEYQLLAHFHRGDPDLRRRVKDFTVRVNRNTCDYLDEVARAAARGFAEADARAAFVADLYARLEADNATLTDEADALLWEIRRAATVRRHPAVGRKVAAAAAAATLAANLAVADGVTHPKEMIPVPPGPVAPPKLPPQVCEMAPMPALMPVKEGTALHVEAEGKLLPVVAARLEAPVDLQLVFALDPKGGVTFCRAQGGAVNVSLNRKALGGVTFVSGKPHRGPWVHLAAAYAKDRVNDARLKASPGDVKAVPGLRMQALRLAALSTPTKKDVTFELWLGGDASVRRAIVTGEGLDAAARTRLDMKGKAAGNKAAAGTYFRFTLPGKEIETFRKNVTHMFETISLPPKSFPRERAPVPPKEK